MNAWGLQTHARQLRLFPWRDVTKPTCLPKYYNSGEYTLGTCFVSKYVEQWKHARPPVRPSRQVSLAGTRVWLVSHVLKGARPVRVGIASWEAAELGPASSAKRRRKDW